MNNPNELSLYLASASPRRRELLNILCTNFKTISPDIDETLESSDFHQAIKNLAIKKAEAGWEMLNHPESVAILSADTLVIFKQRPMGKPHNATEASLFLLAMSGHTHQVITSLALLTKKPGKELIFTTALSITDVTFRALKEEEIEAYIETDEWCDKAGGYGIQGIAGAFVEKMSGSYSGVMGLPLSETLQLLKSAGLSHKLQTLKHQIDQQYGSM
ncbi:MAG: Maf family protein [Pseudomonadota bacterium]